MNVRPREEDLVVLGKDLLEWGLRLLVLLVENGTCLLLALRMEAEDLVDFGVWKVDN
eukprot:CAMPEP_0203701366 /NCGR_PEP_ID=MMETSP0091-20130426/35167_1 /ASSEMBLY_ACC=CAM_ASM_001089 /TAXON_ID=426623 /ORGANISM="Chaetoceros affinis, Strain CCMP159" /LENGTH=56 /DNA_ID=CAMNT_0050575077 /DNA_START=501 /DNA_END=671 /DNA_ORIENTATION=+